MQSGTLGVFSSAPLSTSGHLTAGAGTTFFLDQVTLQAGSTFSGTGTLAMNGQTTVTGAMTVTIPVVLGGTVTGSGALTLAAPITWTTGTVDLAGGGLTVNPGQTLTLSTGGQKVVNPGSALTNHGTVVWTGGTLYVQSNGAVVNASDGVWTVQGDLTLTSTNCGSPTFTNAGLLRKTGITGTFTVGSCVALTNTGTIQLRLGGTVAGQFDRIVAGTVTLGGTLDISLVNGFAPVSGNAFDVLGYTSRVGTFAVVNGNGETYTPTYGASALTLQKP